MIAAFPMYDRPETAAANDALWTAVAQNLGMPDLQLDRHTPPEDGWRDPGLVLSQTCGMPFKLWVKDHARYVASPDFRLPDTPPGYYHSVIIARADDPRPANALLQARPVINQDHSQSGFNALWRFANERHIHFGPVAQSGAHHASAHAVAKGQADIAAIDANTWRMIEKWDAFADLLRVIARTPPTPAMPYICGPSQDPSHLRHALGTAIETLSPDQRDTLGLYGVCEVPVSDYLAVPMPPDAQIAPTTWG